MDSGNPCVSVKAYGIYFSKTFFPARELCGIIEDEARDESNLHESSDHLYEPIDFIIRHRPFGLCPKNRDLQRPGCEGGKISE